MNKSTGAIYFLLESAEEEENFVLDFFGYKSDNEPRLFGLSYSRKLHEQVEKHMRGKLQRGQPVVGRFSKEKEGMNANSGEDGKDDGKGGGSLSQRQEWEFHELRPSDFLRKPE